MTTTRTIEDALFQHAFRFRRAIVGSNPATSSLHTLREFPCCCCGDASLLLAKYLQVNDCGRSLLVLGKRHSQWHAWLQLRQFIIDITADQFEDQDAEIIVSIESPWHSSFSGQIYNVADFCLYDERSCFELTRAYEAIVRHLPS